MKKHFKVYLFSFLLFITNASAQCLSGTYTIGGTTPDYTNFTTAVDSLISQGICGPVTFNVRAGTYVEKIVIPLITGASFSNKIVFQSESLDSNSVSLEFPCSAGDVIVTIDGSQYVTFSHLTVKNTGTSCSGLISLFNAARSCTFSNLQLLTAPAVGGVATCSALLRLNYIDSVVLKNSILKFGDIGVAAAGDDFYSSDVGIRIENNTMINQSTYGIQFFGYRYVTISGNYLISNDSISSAVITLYNVKDVKIFNNRLYSVDSLASIRLENIQTPTAGYGRIFNNMISSAQNNYEYSLYVISSSGLSIVHNSINVSGPCISAGPVRVFLSSGISFNNNVIKTKFGPALLWDRSTFSSCDYNNYYALDGKLLQNNLYPYYNLDDWKLAYFVDFNSLNNLPTFVSDTNLNVASDFSENLSVPFYAWVNSDIDGDVRSVSQPYFGADEYANAVLLNDVNVLSFKGQFPVCGGLGRLYVKIKSKGVAPLTSTELHWKLNGVSQPVINWSGSLAYNDTLTVLLGNCTISSDTDILIWSALPNGSADDYMANDTITDASYSPVMSGVYTVGGLGADYRGLKDGFNDLNKKGMCGPVTFKIRDGVYHESFKLGKVQGNDSINTLTVESENGNPEKVVLEISASEGRFWLDSVSYMSFNNLSMSNGYLITSSAYSMLVLEDCNNISFNKCNYWGNGDFTYSVECTNSDSLKFDKCVFNGNKGCLLITSGKYSMITNNLFSNSSKTFMKMMSDSSVVANNMFKSNSPLSDIGVELVSGSFEVYGNKIYYSSTLYGGISFLLSSIRGKVYNNYTFTDDATVSSGSYGMSILGCWDLDFYNNTIRLINCKPSSTVLRVDYLPGNVNVKNNIFAKSSGGRIVWYEGSYITSDKNDFYSSDGSFSGTCNTINYSTLASWKSSTSKDPNSVALNPSFVGASDLHIAGTSPVVDLATPVTYITDDIDGITRTALPDLGADEADFGYFNSLVWPGDANFDSIVSTSDLLQVGLFYGEFNIARDSIRDDWNGYQCGNWYKTQFDGTDIKHADCNGDGVINYLDTVAISQNYTNTHAIIGTVNENRSSDPPMYWIASAPSYNAGDWVSADLMLGLSAQPVSDLYGIAFDILYDASLVEPGTESIEYPNSWFAVPSSNAMHISKINAGGNIAHGALTRINHLDAIGFGKIATFKFKLNSSFSASDILDLNVINYISNNATGAPVFFDVYPLTNSLTVNINEPFTDNAAINIYPNPYISSTKIVYSLLKTSDVSIEVYNTIGQKIETIVNAKQSAGEYKYTFSAKEKGYDAGIYFVKFTIDGKITMRKIVEVK